MQEALAAPAWDPNFIHSPAHGVAAQRALLNVAVPLCRARRTAVDIGAHIGTWAVELAHRFDLVHAFEPVEENADCLAANVPPRVRVHRVALGAERGTASMSRHGKNSGCWRVAGRGAVAVRPLDEFALQNVDLMKIDVEGYETEVLVGAARTIEASRPVIVFEDNGLGPRLYGSAWRDPKVLLAALNYEHALRVWRDEVWVPR